MQWLLGLALVASLAGLLAPWDSLSHSYRRWIPRLIVTLQILPFVLLVWLFVNDVVDYEIVRLNGGADMPLAYRISAAWGGREGPLLLWAGLLALCGLGFAPRQLDSSGVMWRRLLNGFIFALLCCAFILKPFRAAQGWGRSELNPLLQTDLMVVHPPIVFLFYSLCIITSLFALAAMLTDEKSLLERMLSPARAAFAVGVAGIGLGGLWAYTVLDWGGYWAWDPVETGSLLPWLCLVLVLHLRVTPGKQNSRWAAPLGLLPGWFAVHATMVTRANGVWASVHAFVADGTSNKRPDSAIERILDLRATDVAGTEVTTYLVALLASLFLMVGWMMLRHSTLPINRNRWRVSGLLALALVGLVPLARLQFVDWFSQPSSPLEAAPVWVLLTLCALPLLTIWFPPQRGLGRLLDSPSKSLPLIAIFCLAPQLSDPTVAGLAILLMMLQISAPHDEQKVWITAGVVVLLFAAWGYLVEVYAAAVGMLIFLSPVLLAKVDEEEEPLKDLLQKLQHRSTQLRLARYAPVVLGAGFITLTWMLLLATVDGAELAMHELFGAPFILLMGCALATYAWKDTVDSSKVPYILMVLLVVGILLGTVLVLPLSGDWDNTLGDKIASASLVWLVLPFLLAAIPAIGSLVWKLTKNSVNSDYSLARLKPMLAHFAHLGILLLLLGHLFTTTLVDRADPSHQVILPMDESVSHQGLQLTFTDWVVLDESDPQFAERFDVGDGYIGATIEVQDDNGELIDTVEPGMLRFGAFPRSEVDRTVRWQGDIVYIFDWSQTQEIGNQTMLGGPDSLNNVRLTVYDLTGSHLVWLGWVLVVLASSANWLVWRKGAE